MIRPSAGFILITPLKDDFFATPNQSGLVRTGTVVAVGDPIFHVSGVSLSSPVPVNSKVVFRYFEDEDYPLQEDKYYIVDFNRIIAYE